MAFAMLAPAWAFLLGPVSILLLLPTAALLILVSLRRPDRRKRVRAGVALVLALAALFSWAPLRWASAWLYVTTHRSVLAELVASLPGDQDPDRSPGPGDYAAQLDSRVELASDYVAIVRGGMLDNFYGVVYFPRGPFEFGAESFGSPVGDIVKVRGNWYRFVTH